MTLEAQPTRAQDVVEAAPKLDPAERAAVRQTLDRAWEYAREEANIFLRQDTPQDIPTEIMAKYDEMKAALGAGEVTLRTLFEAFISGKPLRETNAPAGMMRQDNATVSRAGMVATEIQKVMLLHPDVFNMDAPI